MVDIVCLSVQTFLMCGKAFILENLILTLFCEVIRRVVGGGSVTME